LRGNWHKPGANPPPLAVDHIAGRQGGRDGEIECSLRPDYRKIGQNQNRKPRKLRDQSDSGALRLRSNPAPISREAHIYPNESHMREVLLLPDALQL
jgi:hypothetical protein